MHSMSWSWSALNLSLATLLTSLPAAPLLSSPTESISPILGPHSLCEQLGCLSCTVPQAMLSLGRVVCVYMPGVSVTE